MGGSPRLLLLKKEGRHHDRTKTSPWHGLFASELLPTLMPFFQQSFPFLRREKKDTLQVAERELCFFSFVIYCIFFVD